MRDRTVAVLLFNGRLFIQPFSYTGLDTQSRVAFGDPVVCDVSDSEIGKGVLKAFNSCLENKSFPLFRSEYAEYQAGLLRETGCTSVNGVWSRALQIDVREKDGGIEVSFIPSAQSNTKFAKPSFREIVIRCSADPDEITSTIKQVLSLVVGAKKP